MELLILTTVFGLIAAIYNAKIYLLARSFDRKINKQVHRISFALRAGWFAYIWLFPGSAEFKTFVTLYAWVLFSVVYDQVFNYFHGYRWYYLGLEKTTSQIDRFLKRAKLPLQSLLILVTGLFYPLHIFDLLTVVLKSIFANPVSWGITFVLLVYAILMARKFHFKDLTRKGNYKC